MTIYMLPPVCWAIGWRITVCHIRVKAKLFRWIEHSSSWYAYMNIYVKNSLTYAEMTLLYFGLRPGQKYHAKVMHRKEVTHSNGSYERKSRWRKLADEMGRGKKNSHGTLIDWCTGRELPVNCMKVISAEWRSNMRFQKSSRRLSGRWTII